MSQDEVNISNIFCVIYKYNGKDWDVLGQNWSQLNIYKHKSLPQYRLVGWTAGSLEVILNVALTHMCKIKKKSSDFYKYIDEDDVTWGFGFCVKGDNAEAAHAFTKDIHRIIKELEAIQKRPALPPRTLTQRPSSATSAGAAPMGSPARMLKPSQQQQQAATSTPSKASSTSATTGVGSSTGTSPTPEQRSARKNYNTYSQQALDTHTANTARATTPTQATPVQPPALAPRPSVVRKSMISGDMSVISRPLPETSVSTRPAQPRQSLSPDYNMTVGTLGTLPLKPQKPSKLAPAPAASPATASASQLHTSAISQPFKVTHDKHVSFSPSSGYHGLPAEWAREIEKQFGVEARMLPGKQLPEYDAKIPYILLALHELLLAKGGLEAEGIFRLAPDKGQCAEAKNDIDHGRLIGSQARRDATNRIIFDYDVHVIANLIKTWLRDLPTHLLPPDLKGRVSVCDSEAKAWDIVLQLQEPFKSICIYLLDMFAEVCEHSAVNKMTPQNIAICLGPNLFQGNDNDPMATIAYTKKVTEWFKMALEHRRKMEV